MKKADRNIYHDPEYTSLELFHTVCSNMLILNVEQTLKNVQTEIRLLLYIPL